MWTGSTCEKRCELNANYKTSCGDPDQGSHETCRWNVTPLNADGDVITGVGNIVSMGTCTQGCAARTDRDTCDPAQLGGDCLWDDCGLECVAGNSVSECEPTQKKIEQMAATCGRDRIQSYYGYLCTGPASHCYVEDYRTPDAVTKKTPWMWGPGYRCIKKDTGGFAPFTAENNVAEETCEGWMKFWPMHYLGMPAEGGSRGKEQCEADGCRWVEPAFDKCDRGNHAYSEQGNDEWSYEYSATELDWKGEPLFIDGTCGTEEEPCGLQLCAASGGHPDHRCCGGGPCPEGKSGKTEDGSWIEAGHQTSHYCLPDCLALNILAKDPKYASVEPTFSGEEGGSLGKAMHFCNLEYACEWKGGNETSGLGGACGWRGGCGATPGVCDPAGCELARSGGGSEPIEIGGNCASYMSVRGGVGRLKSERCYSKCVTRADEESCMRGAGSRMMDEWTDPAGNKASCDEPMMIGEDGLINGPNAAKYVPQECLVMCRWEPSQGKCFRACEARTTEADCGAPNSGCVWDTDGGMFASGPGHTGATEYGGLPTGIPCTGSPTTALQATTPRCERPQRRRRRTCCLRG